MPDLRAIKELALQKAEFTGEAKLRCVAVTGSAETYPVTGKTYPTFCIDPTSPVMRLSVPYGSTEETTFNRILDFQGHYVAGDIKTYRDGKTIFQLTVDSLEGLAGPQDGLFTVPSDAVLLAKGPPSFGSMKALKNAPAVYPVLAKAQHWVGTVHIQASVDRNGHVLSAKVIDGPVILQQAALNSVNQWIFRPFLVGGEPVDVNTETGMIFRLGR
jgi:TonB family protein